MTQPAPPPQALNDVPGATDVGPPEPAPTVVDEAGKPVATPSEPDRVDIQPLDTERPAGDAPPPGPSKLERAQAGAARATRQAAERRRQAEEAAHFRRERDRLAHQVAWERQQREQAERQAAPLQDLRDPTKRVDALQRLGVDPKQIAEDAVRASTPEGQIEMLRAELAREKSMREEWQQRQRAEAEAAHQRQAEADFVRQASDAEQYPTIARLAKIRPQTLVNEGNALMADVFRRTGRYPSFDQALAWLEHEYSKALEPDKPSRDAGAQQRTSTTPATERQPAAGTRTLSARAAERALLPKSIDQMTREEQIAHFAQQLREGRTG